MRSTLAIHIKPVIDAVVPLQRQCGLSDANRRPRLSALRHQSSWLASNDRTLCWRSTHTWQSVLSVLQHYVLLEHQNRRVCMLV